MRLDIAGLIEWRSGSPVGLREETFVGQFPERSAVYVELATDYDRRWIELAMCEGLQFFKVHKQCVKDGCDQPHVSGPI